MLNFDICGLVFFSHVNSIFFDSNVIWWNFHFLLFSVLCFVVLDGIGVSLSIILYHLIQLELKLEFSLGFLSQPGFLSFSLPLLGLGVNLCFGDWDFLNCSACFEFHY